MRKFDYSFLADGVLPARLFNLAAELFALKAKDDTRKEQYVKVYTELESVARIQSVKSSNAIEGIVTSDERIRAIVTQSSAPLNHDEAEIAGYRDVLSQIHLERQVLDFRQRDILSLHKIMIPNGGEYKKEDNLIMEYGANGERRVRFRPTPASETAHAMEQLELAYVDARDNSSINQLLLIPCVILDFLCVHPFRDGNGRISRLLSLLLLYRNSFDVGKYISFEEQINRHKEAYYSTLERSSIGWAENKNDYFPFMENFIATLYRCYLELDKRFAVLHGRRITKSARIEATVMESLTPISKAQICQILPDVSPTTVEAVLGAMIRRRQIRKIGQSRASKYIRA